MSKEYEIHQDGMMVAGASGENALAEALHYCAEYGQDGPVELFEVTRVQVGTDGVALAASGGNAAQDGAVTDYGTLPELPEPLEINWPTLNSNALGCGVEDRGLHDRYECAAYGWEDGVDRAIECVPEAIYDADQMREYGKACAAASAPNAALVAALRKIKQNETEVFDEDMGEMVVVGLDAEEMAAIAADSLSAAGQEVK